MKIKIHFIERKKSNSVSIEKVFRQIAKSLSPKKFETSFQQLAYSNDVLGTLKNLLFYRRGQADIYHVTGHIHYIALVLPKRKTVLTIHDAGILHIRRGLRRYILKKILFDLPIKKLKYITAVSEATKKEIVLWTNCEESKIRVIENPLQDCFSAVEKDEKKEFNAECPTLLQIGTTYNKNIPNLIKALNGINCRLVIVGELSVEILELLKINRINYENKLGLNDSEIRNEYLKTDIVTFCSTFEGFGLPVIEAQAMKTPVVTSNISPLKEVAGGAAALAEPSDFQSIGNEIRRLIMDKKHRETLVKRGLENVERFQSKKIAEDYENLYREISEEIENSRK
ncbi:MAG: glycosyltransferase family 4 protein [Pyrinomonadaceae bacterium]